MLLGIAYLCPVYGVVATPPEGPGYESVLSQLLGAITGKGVFYWISIASILVVLSLSANTAFADFPRLAPAIAENGFPPHSPTLSGRRLVCSQGVYALAILAAIPLTIFSGVTDHLIPLYAVGAFLAFTLSQAGMVVHWRKNGDPSARRSMLINGLSAVSTAITAAVVLIAKFCEGAWIVVVLVPAVILMMHAVKRHYNRMERHRQAYSGVPLASGGAGRSRPDCPGQNWCYSNRPTGSWCARLAAKMNESRSGSRQLGKW
jgi:amino acid transporter